MVRIARILFRIFDYEYVFINENELTNDLKVKFGPSVYYHFMNDNIITDETKVLLKEHVLTMLLSLYEIHPKPINKTELTPKRAHADTVKALINELKDIGIIDFNINNAGRLEYQIFLTEKGQRVARKFYEGMEEAKK